MAFMLILSGMIKIYRTNKSFTESTSSGLLDQKGNALELLYNPHQQTMI